jgi:hypothetical protein
MLTLRELRIAWELANEEQRKRLLEKYGFETVMIAIGG